MSDRLEELGVPPKLLAAIRNEVRGNIEQQLNDLWMVVHSLKDASTKNLDTAAAVPTLDPAVLDAVTEQLEAVKSQVNEVNKELQRKVRGLRKRVNGQQSMQATPPPPVLPPELLALPDKLHALLDRLDRLEREMGQLGGAATLSENRLIDRLDKLERETSQLGGATTLAENRLVSRLDKLERDSSQSGGAATLFEGRITDRLEKMERELSQLGGAAALFESRLVDQETKLIRRLDEAESRLARTVASSRSAAPAESQDELSTEQLMALSGTVEFSLSDLAKVAIKYNASDLIVRPNSLPYTYLEGDLIPIGQQPLTSADSYRVAMLALQLSERKQLLKNRTFSKLVEYHSVRFLLNAYFERGELAVYARRLTQPPLNLDQLDLPRALEVSLLEERGLILLCGSGLGTLKSLAYALLQPINQQRRARIFTLEDAVSYELPEEQSLLSQLQRGIDISTTADLLRLKPDVLYLQRVATGEELQVALSFASDRTMVIVSCPGSGVVNCVQHLLELTSPEHRGGILGQLGGSLRSILCYRPGQPNEYLINSSKVRPWLERGDMAALQTAVETSQTNKGRPASQQAAGPSRSPQDTGPLPPPSSESLAIKPSPPAPQPQQSAPTGPSGILTPPPVPKGNPAAAKPPVSRQPLQPPPADPEEKSGGDEETLLGWL